MFDVLIIGCGIVGAATSFLLSQYDCKVGVLEQHNDVADETTKANSAILHAGYDPLPGSVMARLNVPGAALAEQWCKDLSVPYQKVGSLVLAFSGEEMETVRSLYKRGIENGVSGLQVLGKEAVIELEPGVNGAVVGALYAPSAAIVDPWEYAIALAETASQNQVEFFLGRKVTGLRSCGDYFQVECEGERFEARYVINAAGVYADEIAAMVGDHSFAVTPRRGQYYLLDKVEHSKVRHVLFQCPTKVGKGVLVAPTVHGNVIVGPNAETVAEKEDVATTQEGLAFVAALARKSVPGLDLRQSIRNFAGLRASAEVGDFVIQASPEAPGLIHLAGIQSPGLSAAPAIAGEALRLLHDAGLTLSKKQGAVVKREQVRFKELTSEEKNRLIQRDPLYGRVICRCETITEGEIVDAIRRPLGATTIDGVKRRCGAGLGRCQGGFCGPRVHEILARELGVDETQVLKDREGSTVLVCHTKTGGEGNV